MRVGGKGLRKRVCEKDWGKRSCATVLGKRVWKKGVEKKRVEKKGVKGKKDRRKRS